MKNLVWPAASRHLRRQWASTRAPFENIWIQPAAGDAGGALGAALFVWYQLLDNERRVEGRDQQQASLLGPAYSDEQIRAFLDSAGAKYHTYDDEPALIARVAELIDAGKVIGWLQGRMEFGPRALGSRSILGDARSQEMQSVMNLKIKFRESFRPFAPCVLREDVAEYFETRPQEDSPYMLLVAAVPRREAAQLTGQSRSWGLDKLKVKRSVVPAITHVDYSARIQTVDPQRHPRLHRLITAFKQRTGCPIIINTSFNIRGEPIVCSPQDAYRCSMATNMDVLVLKSRSCINRSSLKKQHEIDSIRPVSSWTNADRNSMASDT
jgi:carbamoyltransferase